MTDEDIRLACLRLAASQDYATDTLKEAQRYYDFVIGRTDKTPREQIAAALEAAGVR